MLLLEVNIAGTIYVIGSLYAPTADAPEEQSLFMDRLEEGLAELNSVHVILGGDLNVALDPAKDRRADTRPGTYGEIMRRRVRHLMDEMDLTDAWRYRNPAACQFTFHRGKQASRIDYWLDSTHLTDTCTGSDITPIALSDHTLITISLGNLGPKRGPGLWRMDNSLLGDTTYVEEITNLLHDVTAESFDSGPVAKWEWVKYRIRGKTIEFENKRKRARRKEEKELNKRLASLVKMGDAGEQVSTEELESVRRELSEIELARAQGIIFRARANYARYGEKSSKYFQIWSEEKPRGR